MTRYAFIWSLLCANADTHCGVPSLCANTQRQSVYNLHLMCILSAFYLHLHIYIFTLCIPICIVCTMHCIKHVLH